MPKPQARVTGMLRSRGWPSRSIVRGSVARRHQGPNTAPSRRGALGPVGSGLPPAASRSSPEAQPGFRRAAAGQHAGDLQPLVHAEGHVRGLVVDARVGVAVLGSEAEQVARVFLAQLGIVDQQGRGHAVEAVLQRRHFRQRVGRGRHLRRQGRALRRFGRRAGLPGWRSGAWVPQAANSDWIASPAWRGADVQCESWSFYFVIVFRCCRTLRRPVRSMQTPRRH
jgi:hypothetical protein